MSLAEKSSKILYWMYFAIFVVVAYAGAINGIFIFSRKSIISAVLFCVMFVVMVMAMTLKTPTWIRLEKLWIVLLVVGTVARILYFCLIQPVQVSDFYQSAKFYEHLLQNGGYEQYTTLLSEMDDFQIYYSLYPAWGTYMLLSHALFGIFGFHIPILVFLNIFLFVLSFLVLKKLMCKSNLNSATTNLALALLALFPQMIMWSSVTSPDHFTVLGIIILAYIWINERSKKKIVYIILEALCIGMIGLFKPLTALMILVVVCSKILLYIVKRNEKIKILMIESVVFIICTIVISFVVQAVSNKTLENYIKTDITQATSFYLLWGYGVDESGNWSDKAANNIFDEAWKDKNTLEEVVECTDREAIKLVKNNIKLLPRIIAQKFKLLFYSDSWPALWSMKNEDNVLANTLSGNRWVSVVLTSINSISLMLMPFALLKKDKLTVFLSMFWLGYICFLLFSGIQTRYRFISLTFQLVLSIIAFYNLRKIARQKKLFARK